jgi:hypothetical protein
MNMLVMEQQDRLKSVLEEGQLVYDPKIRMCFIGDGQTKGGKLFSNPNGTIPWANNMPNPRCALCRTNNVGIYASFALAFVLGACLTYSINEVLPHGVEQIGIHPSVLRYGLLIIVLLAWLFGMLTSVSIMDVIDRNNHRRRGQEGE